MDAWSKDRPALDTPAVRAGDAAPAAPRDADEETTPAVEQAAGVAEDTTGDLHQWLDRALDQLPAEQRLAIELTYYQGLSCAEVAVIAECPVNTVKTRMFHARRKLRMLLPQLDGSHGGPHA